MVFSRNGMQSSPCLGFTDLLTTPLADLRAGCLGERVFFGRDTRIAPPRTTPQPHSSPGGGREEASPATTAREEPASSGPFKSGRAERMPQMANQLGTLMPSLIRSAAALYKPARARPGCRRHFGQRGGPPPAFRRYFDATIGGKG